MVRIAGKIGYSSLVQWSEALTVHPVVGEPLTSLHGDDEEYLLGVGSGSGGLPTARFSLQRAILIISFLKVCVFGRCNCIGIMISKILLILTFMEIKTKYIEPKMRHPIKSVQGKI